MIYVLQKIIFVIENQENLKGQQILTLMSGDNIKYHTACYQRYRFHAPNMLVDETYLFIMAIIKAYSDRQLSTKFVP